MPNALAVPEALGGFPRLQSAAGEHPSARPLYLPATFSADICVYLPDTNVRPVPFAALPKLLGECVILIVQDAFTPAPNTRKSLYRQVPATKACGRKPPFAPVFIVERPSIVPTTAHTVPCTAQKAKAKTLYRRTASKTAERTGSAPIQAMPYPGPIGPKEVAAP